MDVLALVIVIALASIIAGLAAGGVLQWARAEWRRMWVETWGPTGCPEPFTVADPRIARMVLRQRSFGKRLRREGRSLLAGKAYTPVLTKVEPAAVRTPNVVPLRRARSR